MAQNAVEHFSNEEVALDYYEYSMFGGESLQTNIIRSTISSKFRCFSPQRGTLLDLGSGPGGDIPSLQESFNFDSVYAVDSSAPFIRFVGQRDFGVRVKTQVANLLKDRIEVPENSIDLAVCVCVTPYMESLTHLFSEVSRSLKRGRVFAFDSPVHFSKTWDSIPVFRSNMGLNQYYHSFEWIMEIARRKGMSFLTHHQLESKLSVGFISEYAMFFFVKN